ncbi:phage major capsid protein [Terrabacter sp. MAHUQ-38]|uniref:phage major capsid protein n=1 Tax=unclassified Terrabacter TaxID=2630222 RepID=UPI00165DC3F1|nr:phage major capsid protein [Terrabacter sp. MAHUQ-38]MBC9822744.1 phage major capsid protein [Terrabacter sp. MAHUQ-38]
MSLRTQRVELLAKARVIATKAQDDDRELTDAENREVAGLLAQVDDIDAKIARAEAPGSAKNVLAQISNITHPELDTPTGGKAKASLFDEADEEGMLRAVRTKTQYAAKVGQTRFKATLVSNTTLPTAGTGVSAAPPGTAAVFLRDLMPQQDSDGPTQRYYRIGAASAGTVAEAGVKPDSGVAVTPVDAALIKIANQTKLTDEFLDDAAFLFREVQQEVAMGVLRKENAEIVTAIGGASGIQVATGTLATAIDVLATAIGATEALNGLSPTAVLLNPTNLATIRTQKASTGGDYFIDPLGNGPSHIHGVPIVSTSAVPAGTAYLLTPGFGVFYVRQDVKAELGYDGGDFGSNQQTLRCEERVLPAIVRPGYIVKVTLT